mmetsp:Transcript_87122/g.282112  ORF Transcript_87122/g.282112 Transcript_87122/m.282112 type:complete len:211 (-) Transcript_87122:1253-1885(-)
MRLRCTSKVWSQATCRSKKRRLSRVTSRRSRALAGPCSRKQPERNSSQSMEPLLLMSSISNRHFASDMSTSMSRKYSRRALLCSWLLNSWKLMQPVWSMSKDRKRSRAWWILWMSFTSWARSIAACTKVPVTTFMKSSTPKAMKRAKKTPSQGESFIRGTTSSFQSMPPVRPWKRESVERPREPYHSTSTFEPADVSPSSSRCPTTSCVQ